MSACGACFAWNVPLVMRPFYVVDTGHVPLRFEQWLLYRLHVQMHQANNWSGEIDTLAAQLKANPFATLMPLPQAA